MKHSLTCLLAVLTLALSACHEKEEIVPLSIMKSELEYGSQGGTGSIVFLSSLPVTVSGGSSWLKWTVTENTVTLQVEPNLSMEDRYASLSLQTENERKEFSIVQAGFKFVSTIVSFTCSNERNDKVFHVSSDAPVAFVSSVDWLEWNWKGEEFTVTVQENTGGKLRSGKISWEYGDLSGEMTVIQYGLASLIGKYKFIRTLTGTGWYNQSSSKTYDGEVVEGVAEITDKELILPIMDESSVVKIPVSFQEDEYGDYSIVLPNNAVVIAVSGPVRVQIETKAAVMKPIDITETGFNLKYDSPETEGKIMLTYLAYMPSPRLMGSLSASDISFEMIP